jgi:hypothetical protein
MADKYLYNNAGTLTERAATATSAGVADAGKIPALDATGRLDETMMPVGIGADVAALTASENLAAGDFVNVWDDGGTPSVRKADATTSGKRAHGFVLDSATAASMVNVYFEGTNNSVSGMTVGTVYLSTTPGLAASTAPTGAGNVVQVLGIATGATTINFEGGQPIVLA